MRGLLGLTSSVVQALTEVSGLITFLPCPSQPVSLTALMVTGWLQPFLGGRETISSHVLPFVH